MYCGTVGVVEQIAATHKYWHDERYAAGFDQSWVQKILELPLPTRYRIQVASFTRLRGKSAMTTRMIIHSPCPYGGVQKSYLAFIGNPAPPQAESSEADSEDENEMKKARPTDLEASEKVLS
jgi:hypothetical protein